MAKYERVVDFSDPADYSRFLAGVQRVKKVRWRVTLVEYRPRRSDRQNRYYWPCFCEPFAAKLTEAAGERVTAEEAHEQLKKMFLLRPLIDKKTGVLLAEVTGSSAKLNTSEFNEYLDQCAGFLARIGIVVPQPSVYREQETQTKHPKSAA